MSYVYCRCCGRRSHWMPAEDAMLADPYCEECATPVERCTEEGCTENASDEGFSFGVHLCPQHLEPFLHGTQE